MIKILTERVGLFDKLFLFFNNNYFKILIPHSNNEEIHEIMAYRVYWELKMLVGIKNKFQYHAKILGILPNSNCKKHILYSKQLVDI